MKIPQAVLPAEFLHTTIRRRYWLGLQNFFNLFIPIVDSWTFYDNINLPMELANDAGIIDEEVFNNIKELCLNKKKKDLRAKINQGLKQSFENLLRRKAALGQDMVFADENGQPRVVSAREALAEFESKR